MDELIRMIAKDAPIKAMAITGTALVERARQIHDTMAGGHRGAGPHC